MMMMKNKNQVRGKDGKKHREHRNAKYPMLISFFFDSKKRENSNGNCMQSARLSWYYIKKQDSYWIGEREMEMEMIL